MRWPRGAAPPLVSVLAAAARGTTALPLRRLSDADVRWAIDSGLGPLLFHVTRDDPDARGLPGWRQLLAADLTARVLTGVTGDATAEILDACGTRAGPITLLKGIALASEYYPEPHLRPMRDVDLLVDEGGVPEMEAVLERLGYRRQTSLPPEFYAGHHHTAPFRHPVSGVWVEVHHRLFRPEIGVARDGLFDLEHVRAQRRPLAFRGHSAFRLTDELRLVQVACHWGQELQPVGGMVAMLDLIYVLSRSGSRFDWDRVLGWLEGSRSARYVYVLVTYLARHRLIEVPARVSPSLCASTGDIGAGTLAVLHWLIDRYVVAGCPLRFPMIGRNLDIVWGTLLMPRPPLPRGLLVPWHLLPVVRHRVRVPGSSW
jgi:hypothetical protein